MVFLHARVIAAFLISGVLLSVASVGARGNESPWVEGFKARTRLLAGRAERNGRPRLLAFVEIEMPAGWKTYWRNPGDAGGLPPEFDWSKSANLASAAVLYPAPRRMTDKSGNTIGYMSHVVFPVEIVATDASQPVDLRVTMHFGICKDICVPAEAELALEIAPDAGGEAPEAALAALERVPRAEGERRSADPVLTSTLSHLEEANPRLVIEATFAAEGADIFLEAPDGLYIPLPARIADQGSGKLTFEVPLGADTDLAALRGKVISATLVDAGGASVASFKIE